MKKFFFFLLLFLLLKVSPETNMFSGPSEGWEKYIGEYSIEPPTKSQYTNAVFKEGELTLYNEQKSVTYSWRVRNYFGMDYFFIKNNMYLVRPDDELLILYPVAIEKVQNVYLRRVE